MDQPKNELSHSIKCGTKTIMYVFYRRKRKQWLDQTVSILYKTAKKEIK